MFDSVFAKPRHVKLNDRTGPTVGRGERFVAAGTDVAIDARFAIAENAARRMPRRCGAGVIQPVAVAGRDQHLGVNAAEGFGVGIVDRGGHCESDWMWLRRSAAVSRAAKSS